MTQTIHSRQDGSIAGKTLVIIGLSIFLVAAIGLGVWAFVNYIDQKTDVDTRVDTAVAAAEKAQADADEAKFAEREKEPNRQFVGPDDYGRVTFDYPKTWSVYVNKDVTRGGTYEAYLNPVLVPPVSAVQQYALRVVIEEKDYDKVLANYDADVKAGDLKASSVSANSVNGTRIDGTFSKDIRGSAVIFKIRDKTLTIRTDANTFTKDFDALIKTIKFNQ
ncbi:MAG TPA: hypothetical protein VFS65_00660 [Candidatus Saccharimonadales bacterium]|nr:hypothetical protein [Candidatus Saccharimonadales bacterium]